MKRRRNRGEERFEEIEYEPRSVKDILTEMKDLSEVIIDLAYSALIYDSQSMAKEVHTLESRMDRLKYQIRLTAMMGARKPEEAEQMTGILQVANAAESIANAAGDMVKILDIDMRDRPFLPMVLAEAEEKINAVRIYNDSNITGQSIGELNTESEAGVRIIAVRRRKHWTYDPEDDVILKAGDVLVVSGVGKGFEKLERAAHGLERWEVEE